MRIGQQPFAHAHWQKWRAALLDARAYLIVGLRVGRTLAEDDQWTLCAFQDIEGAFDRFRSWNLRRRGIDHLYERLLSGLGIHHLTEQLGRQIQIDTARTSGNSCADRARKPDADVLRMEHAEGRLAKGLGDRELVDLLVVAVVQVDDLTIGGARHKDYGEAIGGGVGERSQTVKKPGSRNGKTNARLLGEEAGDRRCIARVLLMAKRNDAYAGSLRHAAEVGHRNAWHAVNRIQAVELESIDDEVKAVGEILLCFRRCGFAFFLHCSFCHGSPPDHSVCCFARDGAYWVGFTPESDTGLPP